MKPCFVIPPSFGFWLTKYPGHYVLDLMRAKGAEDHTVDREPSWLRDWGQETHSHLLQVLLPHTGWLLAPFTVERRSIQ